MHFKIIVLCIFLIVNSLYYSGGLNNITLLITNIDNFGNLPDYGEYDGSDIIAGDRRIDGPHLRGWTLLRDNNESMRIVFFTPGAANPNDDAPINISRQHDYSENGNTLEISIVDLGDNKVRFQINGGAPRDVKLPSYEQIGYDLDGNPTDESITYGPTPDEDGNIFLNPKFEFKEKFIYVYSEIYGRKSRRIVTISNNEKYIYKLDANENW